MCHWILLIGALLIHPALAQISTLTVSSSQKLPAPRWMYDGKSPKSTKLIGLLIKARRAELDKNGSACLAALNQAEGLGKAIGEWIDLAELRCGLMPDSKGRLSEPALTKGINKLQLHLTWLSKSSAAASLRSLYSKALLQLADLQLKNNRRSAWATIDKLEQFKDSLSTDDRAHLYRMAGELAFVEQNLPAAQDFFSRSLMERDNSEVRIKLESVRTTLLGKTDEKTTSLVMPTAPSGPSDLGVSTQEQGYFDRMTAGIRSQDYISAVEDAMGLITKYSGGIRAQEASDRVLEVYLSIAASGEDKYRLLLQRVVHQMAAADSSRLLRWAQAAYNRGYYVNAQEFASRAYDKFGNHPDSTKALLLAGKAALASGDYASAEDSFERLSAKAAGSRESLEALFRLGLMKYRTGKYSEAVAFFERVLALNADGEYEYRALYWEWRSLQKQKSERANEYVQRLLDKYPVTYYGLRAQAEKNGGVIQFASLKEPLEVELRLLDSERRAWEKFLLLLQAGWFDEAQNELQNLPEPQSLQERLLRARLWAVAFRYDRAIGLANRAWEKAPELVQTETLRWVYPKEFENFVKPMAAKQKLDDLWIYSLIRQESSFQFDAHSPSNALGLMQLLPATAQQIADEFKLAKFKVPESLMLPDVNIRLGSVYLARMINSFSGNIPLALAAYNAGPARLRRWLAARKDLSGLEKEATSSPDVEIWMDELPWEETSFYVKAILRNWMVYRSLDEGRLQIADPVWKSGG